MSLFYPSSRWYWLCLWCWLFGATLSTLQAEQLQPILEGLDSKTHLQLKRNLEYELLTQQRGVRPYRINTENQEIKVDWGRAVKYQKNSNGLFIIPDVEENLKAFDDFVVKIWSPLLVKEENDGTTFSIKQVYPTWKADRSKWSSKTVKAQVPMVVLGTEEERRWRGLTLRDALAHLLIKYAKDDSRICYIQNRNLSWVPANKLEERVVKQGEKLLLGDPTLFELSAPAASANPKAGRQGRGVEESEGTLAIIGFILGLLVGGLIMRYYLGRQKSQRNTAFELSYSQALKDLANEQAITLHNGKPFSWREFIGRHDTFKKNPTAFFQKLSHTWRELQQEVAKPVDPFLKKLQEKNDPKLRAREGAQYLNEKLRLPKKYKLGIIGSEMALSASPKLDASVEEQLNKLVAGKRSLEQRLGSLRRLEQNANEIIEHFKADRLAVLRDKLNYIQSEHSVDPATRAIKYLDLFSTFDFDQAQELKQSIRNRFDFSQLQKLPKSNPALAKVQKAEIILQWLSELDGSRSDWDRGTAKEVVDQLYQYYVLEEVLKAEQRQEGYWSKAKIRETESSLSGFTRGQVIQRVLNENQALQDRMRIEEELETSINKLKTELEDTKGEYSGLQEKLQNVWQKHQLLFEQLKSKTPVDNRQNTRPEDIAWFIQQLTTLAFRMINLSAHASTSQRSATYSYATAGTVEHPEQDQQLTRETVDAKDIPTYLEQLIKFARHFEVKNLDGVLVNGFAIRPEFLTAEVLKIDTLYRYRWASS